MSQDCGAKIRWGERLANYVLGRPWERKRKAYECSLTRTHLSECCSQFPRKYTTLGRKRFQLVVYPGGLVLD